MHKTLGRSAALAALCVAFCLSSAVRTSAQDLIGQIVRRMDTHNKVLQSLKADVTMVKYDAVLKTTDTLVGEFAYIPEVRKKQKLMMRLNWITENNKAKEESVAVNGEKFELFRPRLNQVVTGKLQKNKDKNTKIPNILGFIGLPQTQLRARYSLTYIGEEQVKSGQKTWHLELKPKTKMSYKSADLWVDADGMPVQAKIVEPNDDSTTVLLSGIRKNITLDRSLFTLKYDKKKVKKIKM
jgi:outer membrane lipoprotein-sorting protein